MMLNSIAQHRAKHINLLLARELASIEREHAQNLITHRKLENSIRRDTNRSSNSTRTKVSIPVDHLNNRQTGSNDSQNIRNNNNNNNNIHANQKRRLSFGTVSSGGSSSQNQPNMGQMDEFSDEISSRRRRNCTKIPHLPPIIKTNARKRENKTHHWMTSFQPIDLTKEDFITSFNMFNEEISKPILPEFTPIQRQIRAFIETLPPYKGAQHGFDRFATAALYSNRAPIAIR